jgi:radical SAM protein with 4Fe4S-binding SPASM domain
MSLTHIEKILNQAADMNVKAIALTGGEPFCFPQFEEVLKLCKERQFECKIATNGTLLDRKHVEMLLKYNVYSLQVSLDTVDPERYAEIKGVEVNLHKKVLDGIRECVETGKLHMAVSSVAIGQIKDEIAKVLQYCHDNGLDTFTLYHIIPYGRAVSAKRKWISEKEFLGVLEELLTEFEMLSQHWAVDLGFPWAFDSEIFHRWKDRLDINPVGCIAGKSAITFQANGEAVPCVCMNDHFFSCGNIETESLKEIWDAPVSRYFRGEKPIEECEACEKFAFCLGGCRTLAYLSSNRIDSADPECKFWN